MLTKEIQDLRSNTSKRGPIKVSKFNLRMIQKSQVKGEGMNGIISKGGTYQRTLDPDMEKIVRIRGLKFQLSPI